MVFESIDLLLHSESSNNQTKIDHLCTWENFVSRNPRAKCFLLFFSCKWLSEGDSSMERNFHNRNWKLNASANWVHALRPFTWGLTVIGNPGTENYSRYKEAEIKWGRMLKREEVRRGERGKVEEPETTEPVRMPGPSKEALVIPCIYSVRLQFYFTQLWGQKKGRKIQKMGLEHEFYSFSTTKYSFTEYTGIRKAASFFSCKWDEVLLPFNIFFLMNESIIIW